METIDERGKTRERSQEYIRREVMSDGRIGYTMRGQQGGIPHVSVSHYKNSRHCDMRLFFPPGH